MLRVYNKMFMWERFASLMVRLPTCDTKLHPPAYLELCARYSNKSPDPRQILPLELGMSQNFQLQPCNNPQNCGAVASATAARLRKDPKTL